ncbi:hypothetical protein HRbin17_01802 [bacterium HR17]|uniref:Uncharacterized protein n=1 Tax=Candidatus Fervidibacter japonicus TaxID=2035412 RepID=A0A2H5XDM8_9BACT|nr:hypothetical protein HRbin17_01802 [bacterium HR17]
MLPVKQKPLTALWLRCTNATWRKQSENKRKRKSVKHKRWCERQRP